MCGNIVVPAFTSQNWIVQETDVVPLETEEQQAMEEAIQQEAPAIQAVHLEMAEEMPSASAVLTFSVIPHFSARK